MEVFTEKDERTEKSLWLSESQTMEEKEATKEIPERSEEFFSLYKEGRTYQEIGNQFGITRERVRQILNLHPQFKQYLKERKAKRLQAAIDSDQERVAQRERRTFEKSLGNEFPERIEELWDVELNDGLDPFKIRSHSTSVEIWFRCPRDGHSWKKRPCDISISWIRNTSGCPKCAGRTRKPTPQPPLIEKYPDFVERFWNWEKNSELGLDPKSVSSASNKKVWLQCIQHSFEWFAPVHATVFQQWSKGNGGCKVCNGTLHRRIGAWSEAPFLIDAFPEQVARYWDIEANALNSVEISPDSITTGSSKRAFFRCPVDGNKWSASIVSVANCWKSGRTGCYVCGRRRTGQNLRSGNRRSQSLSKTREDRVLGAFISGMYLSARRRRENENDESQWMTFDVTFSVTLAEALLRSESRRDTYGSVERVVFIANAFKRVLGEEWVDSEVLSKVPDFEKMSSVLEELNILSDNDAISQQVWADLYEVVTPLLDPSSENSEVDDRDDLDRITMGSLIPFGLLPFDVTTDLDIFADRLKLDSELKHGAIVFCMILQQLLNGHSLVEALESLEAHVAVKFNGKVSDFESVLGALNGKSEPKSGVQESLVQAVQVLKNLDSDFSDVSTGLYEISTESAIVATTLYGALNGYQSLIEEEPSIGSAPGFIMDLGRDLSKGFELGNVWREKYPGF